MGWSSVQSVKHVLQNLRFVLVVVWKIQLLLISTWKPCSSYFCAKFVLCFYDRIQHWFTSSWNQRSVQRKWTVVRTHQGRMARRASASILESDVEVHDTSWPTQHEDIECSCSCNGIQSNVLQSVWSISISICIVRRHSIYNLPKRTALNIEIMMIK